MTSFQYRKLSESYGQIMLMPCNALVRIWSINKHYDNLILALAFSVCLKTCGCP